MALASGGEPEEELNENTSMAFALRTKNVTNGAIYSSYGDQGKLVEPKLDLKYGNKFCLILNL